MRKLGLLLLALGLNWACSSGGNNTDAKTQSEQLTQINGYEEQMLAQESLDTLLARKMAMAYTRYVEDFPQDTLVPIMLKKQGDLYAAWPGHSQKALAAYQTLVEEHQDHPVTPPALFAAAFVYEAQGDFKRQAGAYRMFLRQYPNHPLASDAKNLLVMATDRKQSDLDRVKQWKQQAKKDTTQ